MPVTDFSTKVNENNINDAANLLCDLGDSDCTDEINSVAKELVDNNNKINYDYS